MVLPFFTWVLYVCWLPTAVQLWLWCHTFELIPEQRFSTIMMANPWCLQWVQPTMAMQNAYSLYNPQFHHWFKTQPLLLSWLQIPWSLNEIGFFSRASIFEKYLWYTHLCSFIIDFVWFYFRFSPVLFSCFCPTINLQPIIHCFIQYIIKPS